MTHEKGTRDGAHSLTLDDVGKGGQKEHRRDDSDDKASEEGVGNDAGDTRAPVPIDEVESDSNKDPIQSDSDSDSDRVKSHLNSMGAIIRLRKFKIPPCISVHLAVNTLSDPSRLLNDSRDLQAFNPQREPFRDNGDRLLACYHLNVHAESRGDFGRVQWLYSCLGIHDFVIAVGGGRGEEDYAEVDGEGEEGVCDVSRDGCGGLREEVGGAREED